MGLLSWLSDRFEDADRRLNGEDRQAQGPSVWASPGSADPSAQGASRSGAAVPSPWGEAGPEAPAPGAPAAPAPSEDGAQTPVFDAAMVRPVTIERLGLLFDALDWKWVLDDDGDIASRWNRHNFYFRMVGAQRDVLSVIGFWRGTPREDQREDLMFLIEEWHRNHLWPTCSFREADGEIQPIAELSLDVEKGMTDAQLHTQLRCSLATILEFFDELDANLGVPDPDEESGEDSSEG